MSEGEAAHLGWVTAHPARARRRVRAARVFISPKAAGAPIYSYLPGVGVRLVEEREGMKSKGKQLTLIIGRDVIDHQDLIKL